MKNTQPNKVWFNNTYVNELGDLGSIMSPNLFTDSKWCIVSQEVQSLLDIDNNDLPEWLAFFSGQSHFPGAEPIAQKYAGHQFGHYNPELGDGRGLLFGEIETNHGRWDLHLKGARQTPYSRFGDGKAVLRSCIREFLASEALFHLGIPTSRALGVFTTGEQAQRETIEPAAAMVRVCESHIRFGHFEHAYYQNDLALLQRLCRYTYQHVLPNDNLEKTEDIKDMARIILHYAVQSTAKLIAKWQAFGFCHGVMNTDNMSILGITFDFGPYGFLDNYQPQHICNHSDHSGRYAYDEQPGVALWNLNALGHALSPLLEKEVIQAELQQYEPVLLDTYSSIMRDKMGLTTSQPDDRQLLGELLAIMQKDQRDYTITWRLLSNINPNTDVDKWVDHFISRDIAQAWLIKYRDRVNTENMDNSLRLTKMKLSNPKYILRNYLAQQVIEQAEQNNFQPLNELYQLLKTPYDEQESKHHYAAHPPDWSQSLSISCSS